MIGEKKKRRKKKDDAEEEEDEVEEGEVEDEMEVVEECVEDLKLDPTAKGSYPACDDGVFKVTIAKPSAVAGASTGGDAPAATMEVDQFWPSKRMNTSLTVC